MANTQIDISSNGTKTLLTAGKYCDRNIDVNVNVESGGGEITPTQFTNLLTKSDTIITFNTRVGSTAGTTSTSNGAVLVEITLPHFTSVNNSNCDLFRFRGLTPLNVNVDTSVDGGVTWTRKYLSSPNNYSPDEYGDAVFRLTHATDATGVNNLKARLTLSYGGGTNAGVTEVNLARCLMTQNEPIGNGGYIPQDTSTGTTTT